MRERWLRFRNVASLMRGRIPTFISITFPRIMHSNGLLVEEIAEEGVAVAVEGAAEAAAAALVKAEGASPCLASSRLRPARQRPWGPQPGPGPRRWPASPSGPRRSPRASSTGAAQARRRESTRRARRRCRRPLCRRRHLAPLSPPRVPPPRRGAAPS